MKMDCLHNDIFTAPISGDSEGSWTCNEGHHRRGRTRDSSTYAGLSPGRRGATHTLTYCNVHAKYRYKNAYCQVRSANIGH